MECVDEVHQDGDLPEIVGAAKPFDRKESQGYDKLLGYLDLPEKTLWINLNGDSLELTALHEVGHVIDHWGLGNGPSVVATAPELEGWRTAVFHTVAWRRLYEMATIPGYAFTDPTHGLTLHAEEEDARHARYLLQWAELWARCYAQYIASSSEDRLVGTQLNQLRDSAYGLFYSAQWTEDDFQSVLIIMDRLMKAKGWK